MEAPKATTEATMVSQRCRMAQSSAQPKARMKRPGSARLCFLMCEGSTESPITGAKMTATNHEALRAMAMTVNKEKQYCPVLLAAKPNGRKPKMVTSVPVSMEKAVEV